MTDKKTTEQTAKEKTVEPTPEVATPAISGEGVDDSTKDDTSIEDVEDVEDIEIIPLKTEECIDLSAGKKVTIKRLKAGPYYMAQKTFLVWMDFIQRLGKLNKLGKTKAEEVEEGVVEGEVKDQTLKDIIDEVLSEGVDSINIDKITDLALKSNQQQLLLVSQMMSLTTDEVSEEFYPEDITKILWKGITLNGFLENLKK